MKWSFNLKLGITLIIIISIVYMIGYIIWNHTNITGNLAVASAFISSPLMLLALFLAIIVSIQEYYKIKKRL